MFPIPWNFPFRKKDGSLSTISAEMGGNIPPATANKLGGVKVGSGLSVTSDGTLSGNNELPAYTTATAGKVLTVGDDGSLEWDEKGAGGGDSFLSYDFTKWGNITIDGVQMSANGAEFNNANDYFTLLTSNRKVSDITLYIDTGNLVIPSGLTTHQRFVTSGVDANSGLIWRYTENVWSIYDGNAWITSEITDPAFFDNCTFKIYIGADKRWHVYKNGTLVIESSDGIGIQNYAIYLGSNKGQSLTTGIIKAVRIYSGDYTET